MHIKGYTCMVFLLQTMILMLFAGCSTSPSPATPPPATTLITETLALPFNITGTPTATTTTNVADTKPETGAVEVAASSSQAAGPIALYTFEEGEGAVVHDVSGVEPPIGLTIADMDAVTWDDGALTLNKPTIVESGENAIKLYHAARATNEIAIEAWITPANTTQDGPARIVTMSLDSQKRNITLGQGMWDDLPSSLYVVRLRTTETTEGGLPPLSTSSGTLTAERSHVVYTRDADGIARLYVNGQELASAAIAGDFSNWDRWYHVALGNELTKDRPWLGRFSLVALYNRALTPTEVVAHYEQGKDDIQHAWYEEMATPEPIPTMPITATATPAPAMVSPPPVAKTFPIGVFEDGNKIGGNEKFWAMGESILAHGLDAIMLTNTYSDRDERLLDVSDDLGIAMYMMPSGDLTRHWWGDEAEANRETALRIAEPIVGRFGAHPSFRGYLVKDEPKNSDSEKVALMTQAFQELDPNRPAMPILIGTNRVVPIFDEAEPNVLLIDVYPVGYDNPIGDFTLTGFGYRDLGFVDYIREVSQTKPDDIPLWIILQTHNYGDGGGFSLREPTPAEVRAQQWLAVGEGVTGIFWFVYGTQQGWTGLVDNPALYAEVEDLARRLSPMRETLLTLQKVEDRFSAGSGQDAYVSTLTTRPNGDAQSTETYLVVVNRDCLTIQEIEVEARSEEDRSLLLQDVETKETYEQGDTLSFRPGDGKVLKLAEPES